MNRKRLDYPQGKQPVGETAESTPDPDAQPAERTPADVLPVAFERTITETELISDSDFDPIQLFSDQEEPSEPSTPSTIEHRFVPGTVLGDRYRIIDLIGRGGMGEVYRAEDLKLGQPVALKFLPESMAQNPRWQARFLEEVKISRQISHPNVCRVYDIGELDGQPFITMEFIDGEDLASLLRQIGRIPQSKAVEIGCQICHGLEAAHQRGFLHRDLKPSNLMVDSQGVARITDFGLAALADQIVGADIRQGTPSYMSPEQMIGQDVSQQSDLYALGLVFYKLFTGQPAFRASSRTQLTKLHREAPPIPPSVIVSDLHPGVEKAILWCLEKNPAKRPNSALEVAGALGSYYSNTQDTVLKTLVYSTLTDSDPSIENHTQDLLGRYEGRSLPQRDGSLTFFERPVQAAQFALALSKVRLMHDLEESPEESIARPSTVIHLAEVRLAEDDSNVVTPGTISRIEIPPPHRQSLETLIDLARPGQILLTRGAFDLARQNAIDGFGKVRWLAHGSYELSGLAEAIEIFEVGIQGSAPLIPPAESSSARRQLAQETISGWRPAPELELPERPHWILKKKLGQGGFGEVWLAEHTKTSERRVFKFCYDSASLRSLQREITLFRLLKETLGHRHDITRILDWNFESPPYFIEAEYTEGGNLIEWSERHGGIREIPLVDRLELIAQVATALTAAHSVGVLHKDVKPANVLIIADDTDSVRAQLSDFGVGLVTEKQHLIAAGITVLGWTEELQDSLYGSSNAAGTPLYRAPELLEGKPPTLQADIYALGVMLYQMVVGDFSRALAPGWEHDIEDDLLIEDISSAVAGVPERRLRDAQKLADRLRNLESRREDRATQLREREEAQKARESLERSRGRRQAMAVLLLFLTIFSVALILQNRKAAREAENARRAAAFLENIYKGLDVDAFDESGQGSTQTRDLNSITVRDLLQIASDQIGTELDGQPEIQVGLYRTIGEVYRGFENFAFAAPLFERSLELRRELVGEHHPDTATALADYADILHEVDRLDESLEEAERALALRRKLFDSKRYPEYVAVAESLELLAHILNHMERQEEAEKYALEALKIRKESPEPDETVIAETHDLLGYLLHNQGKNDEALASFEEAYAIRRRVLGAGHLDVAQSLDNLAYLQTQRGDLVDALARGEEARQIREEKLPPKHPKIGESLTTLAQTYEMLRSYDRALKLYRQVLEFKIDSIGENAQYVVFSQVNLARMLTRQEQFEEAQKHFQDALNLIEEDPSQDQDPYRSFIYECLTEMHNASGDPIQALEYADQALDLRQRYYADDPDNTYIIRTQALKAQVLQKLGRYDEAEAILRQGLQKLEQAPDRSPARISRQMTHMAQLLWQDGQFAEAEKQLLQALSIRQSRDYNDPLVQADILNQLARVAADQGKFVQGLDWNRQAIERLSKALPSDHWQLSYFRATDGILHTGMKRFEEAEDELRQAYQHLKDTFEAPHSLTLEVLLHRMNLYRNWGKVDEAERLEGIYWADKKRSIPNTPGPAT